MKISEATTRALMEVLPLIAHISFGEDIYLNGSDILHRNKYTASFHYMQSETNNIDNELLEMLHGYYEVLCMGNTIDEAVMNAVEWIKNNQSRFA